MWQEEQAHHTPSKERQSVPDGERPVVHTTEVIDFFLFICDTIRYETSTIALFAYGGDSGTQRNFPKNTTR